MKMMKITIKVQNLNQKLRARKAHKRNQQVKRVQPQQQEGEEENQKILNLYK